MRQSFIALFLGLSALGVEVPGILTATAEAAAPQSASRGGRVPLIYHKGRSFGIPFNVHPEDRARLKEVQLWVSEDSGFHWKAVSKTTPDRGKFTFRSTHDGEYWFAVRTLTVDNQFMPGLDDTVEPSMKVVVDTIPPSLVLEPDGRRGSVAGVRWEVKDENLDLKTLVLEYQVEGVREWRKVPIRRLALLGAQRWDAGTAEALRVRASVADKAGNVADNVIVLPEGIASQPEAAAREPEYASAPQIAPISDSPEISAGPGFPPVDEDLAAESGSNRRSAPRRSFKQPGEEEERNRGTFPAAPDWDRTASAGTGKDRSASAVSNSPNPAAPTFSNPFPMNDNRGATESFPPTNPALSAANDAAPNSRTMLVSSPRFKLRYDVQGAGPNGPASVELWVTQNGGRTWIRLADDPDRASPIEVDLGGEGTFGLCLVARSASGLGDQPPAPGDPPQSWVEVDSTPPNVQLFPVQVGTGPHAGKVAISWRASDLHLDPRSVMLFWRPEQTGAAWQPILPERLENVGQYVWTVPPNVPGRFHVRVEAVDTSGHRGGAETTDIGPVIVDRSRPRSRIIGLDTNARAGDGPATMPLR